MILDRTERQKLGIKKWVESGCRGTLQWWFWCSNSFSTYS